MLTVSPAPSLAQPPPGSLVAAYSFDEGSGTSVVDASGTGNGGSIGSATWAPTGRYGGALQFNGTTAKVTVGDSPSLRLAAGMTLEAWVYPTGIDASWTDVVFKGNDNYYLMASSTPGRPVGGGIFNGSYGETFGQSMIPVTTWTHLATTYDGATLRLYVDGVQVSSKPQTGTLASSANPLQIGGDDIYGQYFSGLIDEVRVYNVALTAAEIQADMAQPIGSQPPPEFANETVVTNLDFVSAMRFAPGGKMLMAEIGGTIRVVQPGASQPDATPFAVIAGAVAQGDAGLMDLVLDPNAGANRFYYVFYAHAQGASYRDRVSRFTAAADWNSTVAGSEVVLWQDDAATITDAHHGATVIFGPDGKLYISIGDLGSPSDSQSLTNYHGKVLRINSDGSVPSDNPFFDGAGPNKDAIWAYGLRNPYRLSWDVPTGNLYIADVGGNDNSTAFEELNLGAPGANYGWPLCEGPCTPANITDPIYSYPHQGRDAAIMGGFVYRGSQYPSSYVGSYFFADYAQNWIKRLTLNAAGTVVTGVFNFEPLNGASDTPTVGDPVQLHQGPDGALYYLDLSFDEQSGTFNAGTLRRMRYTGGGVNQPPTVAAAGSPLVGSPPLNVTFSSAGTTDPEGDTLTYLWDFGDGSTSTAPNPSHTFQASGHYNVKLTVSDGTSSPFKTLAITVGNPPVGQILGPADSSLFKAGDHIVISGAATDAEDGTLPPSAFSWTIVFRHEGHAHPVVGPIVGVNTTSFDIPVTGHDFAGFTRYEITLTVTDSDGLEHSSSVLIFPDKVNLSFATQPPGLSIQVDGITRLTPFVLDEVKGFQHTINAPAQVSGGTSYTFASWSDGGAQSHTIVTPTSNQSYVATYQASSSGPVAAYAFNEGAGSTVADASGNGNGGTIGTATWTTLGKFGNALTFNGSTARVTVPDAPSLRLSNAMTLEAWINPSVRTNAWRDVLMKGTDNYYLMSSSKKSSRPAGGGIFNGIHGETFGPSALPLNTWTHLAATYDGATLRLFVNGVQVSSKAQTGTLTSSSGALQIGGDAVFGQYFAGRIDEVRVYATALSAAQIQTDMATPIP